MKKSEVKFLLNELKAMKSICELYDDAKKSGNEAQMDSICKDACEAADTIIGFLEISIDDAYEYIDEHPTSSKAEDLEEDVEYMENAIEHLNEWVDEENDLDPVYLDMSIDEIETMLPAPPQPKKKAKSRSKRR